ncbi:MAG: hypothetical protein U5L09_04175 [Bacteroidales bacterium]|nr:hypothetical protein [Bacteroidales bacterium]
MNNKGFHLSSITQKTVLAIAGMFLILFLIVHLGINLFLMPITEGHAEIFAEAAHFMGTNPVVKVFEVVLMATFLVHIVLGIIIQVQNWKARGQRYAVYGKSETTFGSRFMIHTGIVIFIFLVLHFIHFYFVKLGVVEPMAGANVPQPAEEHFYELAVYLFTNENHLFGSVYCSLCVFSCPPEPRISVGISDVRPQPPELYAGYKNHWHYLCACSQPRVYLHTSILFGCIRFFDNKTLRYHDKIKFQNTRRFYRREMDQL